MQEVKCRKVEKKKGPRVIFVKNSTRSFLVPPILNLNNSVLVATLILFLCAKFAMLFSFFVLCTMCLRLFLCVCVCVCICLFATGAILYSPSLFAVVFLCQKGGAKNLR